MVTEDTDPELQLPGLSTDPARFAETMVMHRFKARLFFAWYDWWIGAYWDRKDRLLYLCPLPMVGLKVVIPRDWARKFREHWAFIPFVAIISVMTGLSLGAVIFHKQLQPMVFSAMPSAPSSLAAPVPIATPMSTMTAAALTVAASVDREPSMTDSASGFATSRAPLPSAAPPKALPVAPRVSVSTLAPNPFPATSKTDLATDRFDSDSDLYRKRK